MTLLRSVIMAFSLFSRIPMPKVDWSERNMRYLMAAFPLVGLCVGGCSWAWWQLCERLGFGELLLAVGLALIPLLVTGGIHLDGFADVLDALSSHAEPARKREIMKDPHVGAFAIMGICGYLLAYVALASELDEGHLVSLVLIPVISRCLSGYATVTFKRSSSTGMLATEGSTADGRTVRAILCATFIIATALMVMRDGIVGLVCALSALIVLVTTKRLADREFGGMSGDLAGYFLQVAELAMLFCLVFVGRVA